jgi:hypothetical protein
MDDDRLLEVFRALARQGVRYKVVGGIALNLLASYEPPRTSTFSSIPSRRTSIV